MYERPEAFELLEDAVRRRKQEARRLALAARERTPPEVRWRIRFEIAEELGVSPRTVSAYLGRGRRRR